MNSETVYAFEEGYGEYRITWDGEKSLTIDEVN